LWLSSIEKVLHFSVVFCSRLSLVFHIRYFMFSRTLGSWKIFFYINCDKFSQNSNSSGQIFIHTEWHRDIEEVCFYRSDRCLCGMWVLMANDIQLMKFITFAILIFNWKYEIENPSGRSTEESKIWPQTSAGAYTGRGFGGQRRREHPK